MVVHDEGFKYRQLFFAAAELLAEVFHGGLQLAQAHFQLFVIGRATHGGQLLEIEFVGIEVCLLGQTLAERIEAAESTMDGHDVLKAVLRADINNLQATLDEVDQDNFDQAVDMILSAKHIYIIGMRTSTTLADFLGIYLKLLLDDVTVVKEIAAREVYEQMLRIGEGGSAVEVGFDGPGDASALRNPE